MKSGRYVNMNPDTFYRTFITALLEGTVTHYIAFYDNSGLKHCNTYGSNYSELALELVITKLSDYIYKIRVYKDMRTKEERLEAIKYDSE